MYKVSTTYGFWTAILLIAYFLLVRLIGWHLYPILSAVNGLIFGVGIYLALKKKGGEEHEMKYEHGFGIAMATGIIASVIFTIFMAIYMYQIDPDFAYAIMEQWNMDENLSTFMLLILILTMGVVTSLVLALTFMQLLKRSWNTKDGNRNRL